MVSEPSPKDLNWLSFGWNPNTERERLLRLKESIGDIDSYGIFMATDIDDPKTEGVIRNGCFINY